MRSITWLLVLAGVGLGVSALRAADGGDAQERRRLVGLWRGFVVEGKGESPNRGPVKLEMRITEQSIQAKQFREKEESDLGQGSFILGLDSNPKTMDGTQTNARGRADTWLGIYSRDGDTLKWCVSKKQRPTSFETVKGQFLVIVKRAEK